MNALTAPVLVLEDSDEDFETLVEATNGTKLRHDLQRATTGDECLARLKGSEGVRVLPSIILLDLNTPGIDGRETLAVIRADPELSCVPVVILSTSANPRDVNYCYAHGANAYHVKPVRYEQHLELVDEIFSYWLERAVLCQPKGVPT